MIQPDQLDNSPEDPEAIDKNSSKSKKPGEMYDHTMEVDSRNGI